MTIKKKPLIIALLIPLLVGGLSALFTGRMDTFKTLDKPPLSPPSWVFPVAWTLLYLLMGFASYLVYTDSAPAYKKNNALLIYGIQLFFNFFWSIIFFSWELYTVAFVWLMIMWVLIIITTVKFWKINKAAGYLMIPYLLWVTFAAYLNLGIVILN
ncbi:MAG: tryptophan-rich sensory protein [Clostridia bacterium]|nr:tryptophan-rich sensory protein [Clostridia bacterium]